MVAEFLVTNMLYNKYSSFLCSHHHDTSRIVEVKNTFAARQKEIKQQIKTAKGEEHSKLAKESNKLKNQLHELNTLLSLYSKANFIKDELDKNKRQGSDVNESAGYRFGYPEREITIRVK